MSSFQGIVLTALTFTPSNTPTFARRSNEESTAHITAPSMSEIDAMSTTSQAESPTYVPSSRSRSPIPIPSRHTVADNPISPRSAANILDSGTYLDPDTLQGITKALLKTIKQQETNHVAEVRELNARIARLEDLVKTHTDTFERCPEGYVLNTKYPGLTINIGNSLQREVKWVKQLEQGTVACFTEDNGLRDTPHIVKIYTQPCTSTEPIKPLPIWLESILLGLSATFNTLTEASRELDDWGIHADLLRFRELDASWQEAEGEEHKWEARANAFALAKNLCKSHLEVAHCAYQLGAFENLGPICQGLQLACRGHHPTLLVRGHNNVGEE